MKYLALLRGINVGGKNSIKMVDLKACFDDMKFDNVKTYIQSGNVVFESSVKNEKALLKKIESALSKTFKITLPVVVVSERHLKRIVKDAPKGFGTKPNKYLYDVIFLKDPLTVKEAMEYVTLKEGVDQVATGDKVIYFWRLAAKAAQSRISRIVATPAYKNMTIRNWNTTTKLLKLMEAEK